MTRLKMQESKLEVFGDSQGTDLLKERWPFFVRTNELAFLYVIAQDQKAIAFEVASAEIPAPGATHLTLAGTLVLEVGLAQNTVEHTSLPMRKGTEIVVGPMTYTITDVDDAPGPQYEMAVTLKGLTDLSEIHEVKFFDDHGDEIDAEPSGPRLYASDDQCESDVSITYNLTRAADTATVRVTYWEKRADITVPFEVEATLAPDEPPPSEGS